MAPGFRSSLCWAGLFFHGSCSPDACPGGTERAPDGMCYPVDDPGPDDGDTGAPTTSPVTDDPIRVIGFEGEQSRTAQLLEWSDAAIISEDSGALCGVAGLGLVDLTTGTTRQIRPAPTCLRMASHDGVLVASDRGTNIAVLDVSDPSDIRDVGSIQFLVDDIRHEGLDVHRQTVIVGWHENGAPLFSLDGRRVATIPATDAFAVGIHENRAVISDDSELVLWDVSNPANLQELSRVAMPGEGRDIGFDGSRVAVAMGGRGVGVWDIESDRLVERGTMVVPGSGLSVSLDGDEVWVGSWEQLVLLRLTEEGLVSVGHEAPRFSAMGVDVRDGTALLGDWHGHMTLERQPGISASEIDLEERLFFTEGAPVRELRVENHGEVPLDWSLNGGVPGFMVEPTALTVSPGEVGLVRIEAESGGDLRGMLRWSSNDPDEPSGEVRLEPPSGGIGTPHEDFSLQGFVWPSRDLSTYTLSEQQGRVVVLAYFALY